MISRHTRIGRGVALPAALVCLTLNVPALAQDDPASPADEPSPFDSPPPPSDSESESSEPTTPEEPAPAAEPEEEPAPEPATAGAEAGASVEASASSSTGAKAKADASGSAEEGPKTASGTSPEREKIVQMVGLEQLVGSAYPADQIRGIKYGSLWRTFHGQQWPYMPMLQGEPGIRIGVSGGIWNDLSSTNIAVDQSLEGANVFDQTRWTTQTRGVVRATPTYSTDNGWFAQGNAEIVIQGDMLANIQTKVLATTDDLFVRVGKWKLFDVTVGRFQGWEIANHYGMALDINTLERSGAAIVTGPGASLPKPSDGYGLSYFWDRKDNLTGAYAVHFYPTNFLRAELLGHVGAGNSAFANNPYQIDVRPSAIFDIGWVKLKAGWEYGKAKAQDHNPAFKGSDEKNGYGFAAQFVFAPYVEFGGNFARGFQDVLDNLGQPDLNNSNTVQTFGGFLNASPGYEPVVIGLGAFWNHWEDFRYDRNMGAHFGKVDTNDQRLLFATVQYTLWDRLYMKFVLAHAQNDVEHFNAGIYTNKALSGRFRAEFLF